MPPAGSTATPGPAGAAVGSSSDRAISPRILEGRYVSAAAKLAQQDQEVPAKEIGLVLDRLAAPAGHEHVEELAVADFLAHRRVVVEGVQQFMDDARDLALRDHQVAAAEGPVPV